MAKEVVYCDYCVYGITREKCREWLASAHVDLYCRLYSVTLPPATTDKVVEKLDIIKLDDAGELSSDDDEGEGEGEGEKKRHQTRGGKGMIRDESQKLTKEEEKRARAKLQIKRTDRSRRKAVTTIKGLELFGTMLQGGLDCCISVGLELKKVAKRLAGKYACGASVVKNPAGFDEVAVQGDFVDDLLDFIPAEFKEIKASQIEIVEK